MDKNKKLADKTKTGNQSVDKPCLTVEQLKKIKSDKLDKVTNQETVRK